MFRWNKRNVEGFGGIWGSRKGQNETDRKGIMEPEEGNIC